MSTLEITGYATFLIGVLFYLIGFRLLLIHNRYADLARKDREARPKPPQWPYCASVRYGHKPE